MSVPCLSTIYGIMLVLLIWYLTVSNMMKLLLILFGDGELNPDPFTPEKSKRILAMLDILPMIDEGQTTLQDKLAEIKNQKQESVEGKLKGLASTLQAVEGEL